MKCTHKSASNVSHTMHTSAKTQAEQRRCMKDFTCKHKTDRYSLCAFFDIINICVFNSFLLATENGGVVSVKRRRRDYMKCLCADRAQENMPNSFKHIQYTRMQNVSHQGNIPEQPIEDQNYPNPTE